MDIRDLQQRAFNHAHDKGFWDDANDALDRTDDEDAFKSLFDAFVGQKIALIHSELSEAVEEMRGGDWIPRYGPGGKPEGVPSELADAVIRIADLCGWAGIDLDYAITEKLEYNSANRGHKHGKSF